MLGSIRCPACGQVWPLHAATCPYHPRYAIREPSRFARRTMIDVDRFARTGRVAPLRRDLPRTPPF